MEAPGLVELRRGVLAVSVLHDVDIEPAEFGVRLPGEPPVGVTWTECRRALAGCDPGSEVGRQRLADLLLGRRWAADVGPDALLLALRPVGLPVDHAVHPGLDWVCHRVLGGALDLGLGAVGLDPRDADRVVLVPTAVLDAAGIAADAGWRQAAGALERLGELAAARLPLDPSGRLRPFGDCDVVTLLGSRAMRVALAEAAGGMAALAVPMRTRGWTRLALIDPAFAPAAAAATAPAERGFPRPVLVTADEVALVPEGGRAQDLALRDPGVDQPWDRDLLYR